MDSHFHTGGQIRDEEEMLRSSVLFKNTREVLPLLDQEGYPLLEQSIISWRADACGRFIDKSSGLRVFVSYLFITNFLFPVMSAAVSSFAERFQLFLQSLFAEAMLVEDREPAFSFDVPVVGGTMDVLLPKLNFWLQIACLLIIQVFFLLSFAVVIYQVIIANRGKTFTYILGYSILIPLVLQLPFPLINYLKLRGRVFRIAFAILPTNVTFRCIEAMHGTSPVAVEASLANYLTYYSTLVDYVWNPKTLTRERVTAKQLASLLGQIALHFCGVSIMLSILLGAPNKFKPFPAPNLQLDQFNVALTPGELANNYLYAVTLFFILSVQFSVAGLTNNAQGFLTEKAFLNPLWSSKSPSDFWGRRWNRVIHVTLKRGAFLPLVKSGGYPKWVGILGAFVASGLLHDYSWSIVFYKSIHDYDPVSGELYPDSAFTPLPFKRSVFFLWCAVTMVLERPLAKLAPIGWMSKHLPLVVRSTLVVLTALPIAHYFGGDWMMGNYFDEYSHGVFRFIYYK